MTNSAANHPDENDSVKTNSGGENKVTGGATSVDDEKAISNSPQDTSHKTPVGAVSNEDEKTMHDLPLKTYLQSLRRTQKVDKPTRQTKVQSDDDCSISNDNIDTALSDTVKTNSQCNLITIPNPDYDQVNGWNRENTIPGFPDFNNNDPGFVALEVNDVGIEASERSASVANIPRLANSEIPRTSPKNTSNIRSNPEKIYEMEAVGGGANNNPQNSSFDIGDVVNEPLDSVEETARDVNRKGETQQGSNGNVRSCSVSYHWNKPCKTDINFDKDSINEDLLSEKNVYKNNLASASFGQCLLHSRYEHFKTENQKKNGNNSGSKGQPGAQDGEHEAEFAGDISSDVAVSNPRCEEDDEVSQSQANNYSSFCKFSWITFFNNKIHFEDTFPEHIKEYEWYDDMVAVSKTQNISENVEHYERVAETSVSGKEGQTSLGGKNSASEQMGNLEGSCPPETLPVETVIQTTTTTRSIMKRVTVSKRFFDEVEIPRAEDAVIKSSDVGTTTSETEVTLTTTVTANQSVVTNSSNVTTTGNQASVQAVSNVLPQPLVHASSRGASAQRPTEVERRFHRNSPNYASYGGRPFGRAGARNPRQYTRGQRGGRGSNLYWTQYQTSSGAQPGYNYNAATYSMDSRHYHGKGYNNTYKFDRRASRNQARVDTPSRAASNGNQTAALQRTSRSSTDVANAASGRDTMQTHSSLPSTESKIPEHTESQSEISQRTDSEPSHGASRNAQSTVPNTSIRNATDVRNEALTPPPVEQRDRETPVYTPEGSHIESRIGCGQRPSCGENRNKQLVEITSTDKTNTGSQAIPQLPSSRVAITTHTVEHTPSHATVTSNQAAECAAANATSITSQSSDLPATSQSPPITTVASHQASALNTINATSMTKQNSVSFLAKSQSVKKEKFGKNQTSMNTTKSVPKHLPSSVTSHTEATSSYAKEYGAVNTTGVKHQMSVDSPTDRPIVTQTPLDDCQPRTYNLNTTEPVTNQTAMHTLSDTTVTNSQTVVCSPISATAGERPPTANSFNVGIPTIHHTPSPGTSHTAPYFNRYTLSGATGACAQAAEYSAVTATASINQTENDSSLTESQIANQQPYSSSTGASSELNRAELNPSAASWDQNRIVTPLDGVAIANQFTTQNISGGPFIQSLPVVPGASFQSHPAGFVPQHDPSILYATPSAISDQRPVQHHFRSLMPSNWPQEYSDYNSGAFIPQPTVQAPFTVANIQSQAPAHVAFGAGFIPNQNIINIPYAAVAPEYYQTNLAHSSYSAPVSAQPTTALNFQTAVHPYNVIPVENENGAYFPCYILPANVMQTENHSLSYPFVPPNLTQIEHQSGVNLPFYVPYSVQQTENQNGAYSAHTVRQAEFQTAVASSSIGVANFVGESNSIVVTTTNLTEVHTSSPGTVHSSNRATHRESSFTLTDANASREAEITGVSMVPTTHCDSCHARGLVCTIPSGSPTFVCEPPDRTAARSPTRVLSPANGTSNQNQMLIHDSSNRISETQSAVFTTTTVTAVTTSTTRTENIPPVTAQVSEISVTADSSTAITQSTPADQISQASAHRSSNISLTINGNQIYCAPIHPDKLKDLLNKDCDEAAIRNCALVVPLTSISALNRWETTQNTTTVNAIANDNTEQRFQAVIEDQVNIQTSSSELTNREHTSEENNEDHVSFQTQSSSFIPPRSSFDGAVKQNQSEGTGSVSHNEEPTLEVSNRDLTTLQTPPSPFINQISNQAQRSFNIDDIQSQAGRTALVPHKGEPTIEAATEDLVNFQTPPSPFFIQNPNQARSSVGEAVIQRQPERIHSYSCNDRPTVETANRGKNNQHSSTRVSHNINRNLVQHPLRGTGLRNKAVRTSSYGRVPTVGQAKVQKSYSAAAKKGLELNSSNATHCPSNTSSSTSTATTGDRNATETTAVEHFNQSQSSANNPSPQVPIKNRNYYCRYREPKVKSGHQQNDRTETDSQQTRNAKGDKPVSKLTDRKVPLKQNQMQVVGSKKGFGTSSDLKNIVSKSTQGKQFSARSRSNGQVERSQTCPQNKHRREKVERKQDHLPAAPENEPGQVCSRTVAGHEPAQIHAQGNEPFQDLPQKAPDDSELIHYEDNGAVHSTDPDPGSSGGVDNKTTYTAVEAEDLECFYSPASSPKKPWVEQTEGVDIFYSPQSSPQKYWTERAEENEPINYSGESEYSDPVYSTDSNLKNSQADGTEDNEKNHSIDSEYTEDNGTVYSIEYGPKISKREQTDDTEPYCSEDLEHNEDNKVDYSKGSGAKMSGPEQTENNVDPNPKKRCEEQTEEANVPENECETANGKRSHQIDQLTSEKERVHPGQSENKEPLENQTTDSAVPPKKQSHPIDSEDRAICENQEANSRPKNQNNIKNVNNGTSANSPTVNNSPLTKSQRKKRRKNMNKQCVQSAKATEKNAKQTSSEQKGDGKNILENQLVVGKAASKMTNTSSVQNETVSGKTPLKESQANASAESKENCKEVFKHVKETTDKKDQRSENEKGKTDENGHQALGNGVAKPSQVKSSVKEENEQPESNDIGKIQAQANATGKTEDFNGNEKVGEHVTGQSSSTTNTGGKNKKGKKAKGQDKEEQKENEFKGLICTHNNNVYFGSKKGKSNQEGAMNLEEMIQGVEDGLSKSCLKCLKEAADEKAQAEAKKKLEADKKAQAEAKKKLEADKKAQAEAKKKLEADKKAQAEAKKKLEADKKAQAETKKKLEADKKNAQANREENQIESNPDGGVTTTYTEEPASTPIFNFNPDIEGCTILASYILPWAYLFKDKLIGYDIRAMKTPKTKEDIEERQVLNRRYRRFLESSMDFLDRNQPHGYLWQFIQFLPGGIRYYFDILEHRRQQLRETIAERSQQVPQSSTGATNMKPETVSVADKTKHLRQVSGQNGRENSSQVSFKNETISNVTVPSPNRDLNLSEVLGNSRVPEATTSSHFTEANALNKDEVGNNRTQRIIPEIVITDFDSNQSTAMHVSDNDEQDSFDLDVSLDPPPSYEEIYGMVSKMPKKLLRCCCGGAHPREQKKECEKKEGEKKEGEKKEGEKKEGKKKEGEKKKSQEAEILLNGVDHDEEDEIVDLHEEFNKKYGINERNPNRENTGQQEGTNKNPPPPLLLPVPPRRNLMVPNSETREERGIERLSSFEYAFGWSKISPEQSTDFRASSSGTAIDSSWTKDAIRQVFNGFNTPQIKANGQPHGLPGRTKLFRRVNPFVGNDRRVSVNENTTHNTQENPEVNTESRISKEPGKDNTSGVESYHAEQPNTPGAPQESNRRIPPAAVRQADTTNVPSEPIYTQPRSLRGLSQTVANSIQGQSCSFRRIQRNQGTGLSLFGERCQYTLRDKDHTRTELTDNEKLFTPPNEWVQQGLCFYCGNHSMFVDELKCCLRCSEGVTLWSWLSQMEHIEWSSSEDDVYITATDEEDKKDGGKKKKKKKKRKKNTRDDHVKGMDEKVDESKIDDPGKVNQAYGHSSNEIGQRSVHRVDEDIKKASESQDRRGNPTRRRNLDRRENPSQRAREGEVKNTNGTGALIRLPNDAMRKREEKIVKVLRGKPKAEPQPAGASVVRECTPSQRRIPPTRPRLGHGMSRCMCCWRTENLYVCSNCMSISYCSSVCMANDTKYHWFDCKFKRTWNEAESAIPTPVKDLIKEEGLQLITKFRHVPDLFQYFRGAKRALLTKVGAFLEDSGSARFAVYIQDSISNVVPLMFFVDTDEYYERSKRFPSQLKSLLFPGRFIIIFYPVWATFDNLTDGLRVTDLRHLFFLPESMKAQLLSDCEELLLCQSNVLH